MFLMIPKMSLLFLVLISIPFVSLYLLFWGWKQLSKLTRPFASHQTPHNFECESVARNIGLSSTISSVWKRRSYKYAYPYKTYKNHHITVPNKRQKIKVHTTSLFCHVLLSNVIRSWSLGLEKSLLSKIHSVSPTLKMPSEWNNLQRCKVTKAKAKKS